MSEPIHDLALHAIHNQSSTGPTDADSTVRRLFMLLHGQYGNLLLSKFSTGEVDAQGKDRGMKSAQIVWASDLAKYDSEIIRAAAERCKIDHPQYPPTLGQFSAICRAMSPVKTYREADDGLKQIGISTEAQSANSKRVREAAMARLTKIEEARSGLVDAPQGVSGLCQLIAKAVGLAGGNEVAELRRLDLMFSRKAA